MTRNDGHIKTKSEISINTHTNYKALLAAQSGFWCQSSRHKAERVTNSVSSFSEGCILAPFYHPVCVHDELRTVRRHHNCLLG